MRYFIDSAYYSAWHVAGSRYHPLVLLLMMMMIPVLFKDEDFQYNRPKWDSQLSQFRLNKLLDNCEFQFPFLQNEGNYSEMESCMQLQGDNIEKCLAQNPRSHCFRRAKSPLVRDPQHIHTHSFLLFPSTCTLKFLLPWNTH